MAVKKKRHGGARAKAGRPKTGKNTVVIAFSVHKDFAEPIKALVKEKVAELKGEKVASETLADKTIEASKSLSAAAGPAVTVTIKKENHGPKRTESVNNFLKNRMQQKNKVKE